MDHTEIIDALKLAAGIASAVVGAVFVAIGFLFRVAYRLGGDAKEIKSGLERLKKLEERIEDVPLLKQRIGTVEEAWRTVRSDIKHLLRGSHPGFNGTGDDQ